MAIDNFGMSATGSSSYTDQIVEAYKATQAYRTQSIEDKRTDLNTRKSFYGGLNGKLNSLISTIDKFGEYKQVGDNYSFVKEDGIDDDFRTRTATLSEKDYFTISTDGDAIVGNSSLKVQRLATNDVLVSKRLTLKDSFGEKEGESEFKIKVGDEEFDVKVKFTGNETSEEAMTKIVNAINSIEDIEVSASLVKDTETTGRISLVSKETGADYAISMTTNSTTRALGWDNNLFNNSNNRSKMQEGDAGYKRTDVSELNSKFEVNGIEITRNSNEIKDVLPGSTITLKKVQDADAEPVSITTEINTAGVESLVDTLVKEFNGLLFFLNNNKSIQRQDPGMGTLQTRLRALSSTQLVETDNPDAPRYITDIGFRIQSDGTLVLKDKDKLKEYLEKENGAQMVADLFTSTTGFAAKISETISSLKPKDGEIGLIKSRNESINTQLQSLDRRLSDVENTIDQQAEALRKEYTKYLEVYMKAQSQYSLISTMSVNSSSNSYNSLLSSQYSS